MRNVNEDLISLFKDQIKSISNRNDNFQLFLFRERHMLRKTMKIIQIYGWNMLQQATFLNQIRSSKIGCDYFYINSGIHKFHRLRNMRQQKKYLSRLQKISETSSPSKQQQSPIQTTSIKSRINPANLTSSYLKFKTFEQQKSKRTFYLEESMKAQHQTNFCQNKNDLQSNRKTLTIEDKNQKISNLQEMIVRKKMELTLLQECYEKRGDSAKKDKFDSVFSSLLTNTLKLCEKNKQGRKAYLSMVLRYGKERKNNPEKAFKFLMQWVLKIVKQFFSALGKLLKIPTSNNE